jgi:hypothetical protein
MLTVANLPTWYKMPGPTGLWSGRGRSTKVRPGQATSGPNPEGGLGAHPNRPMCGRGTRGRPRRLAPHGGCLSNPLVEPERAMARCQASRRWPSWALTPRQRCDLELLLNAGFSRCWDS